MTIAMDDEVFTLEDLHKVVTHHAAVVGVHQGTINIEGVRLLQVQAILTVVIKNLRLGTALAVIVSITNTNGLHCGPVTLGLRVNF